MQKMPFVRVLDSVLGNRKTKIQNRKLVGIVALVFAIAICGAAAEAQQTGKIFRIGFLDASTASGSAVLVDAFRQELSKLGWVEGKNIAIDYRFAEQKRERVPELAADLVRLKVQQATKFEFVISLKAAQQIGLTIPVNVLERANKVIK
jgi:hypothetical protein